VQLAALNDGVIEHLGDRTAQRLGAVEHHQQRPGRVESAVAQAGQQVTHHGGVLGGALGQGERDLGAVQGDPQRNHTGVLGHPDPIHQQRHQVQAGQILGEQLGQGVLGAGDESARDRRFRRPRGGGRNTGAYRFQAGWIAATRELGKHPLQRELAEQLGRGERLVGRHRQLSGAVGGPDSGSTHPHPPAAEGHLAGLGAVADRGPGGVVAAFGPDQPSDVFLQHDLEHLQAGPDRQGEQTLAGGAGQLGHGDDHPLGQVIQGLVGGGSALGILRHGGPLLVELLGGCPTPTTRQASGGDRHLNFYGNRDNLPQPHGSARRAHNWTR
jgi:hypothetical protein